MNDAKNLYYQKRGQNLIHNLTKRHFEAYYCASKSEALEKALSLIPTALCDLIEKLSPDR